MYRKKKKSSVVILNLLEYTRSTVVERIHSRIRNSAWAIFAVSYYYYDRRCPVLRILASDSYLLFVQGQATFLLQYPVYYYCPPKVLKRDFLTSTRIIRTCYLLRTGLFILYGGYSERVRLLLRIVWGEGWWQPKRRMPPAATSNQLLRTYL